MGRRFSKPKLSNCRNGIHWVSLAILLIALLSAATGCGKKSTPRPVTATVAVNPGTTQSLEIGTLLGFAAQAKASNGAIVSGVTFTWNSSDPTILQIANNGLACAGTWNSLTLPIICSPGGAGTVIVTASAGNIPSPPVQVFVHQHVDRLVISPIAPPASGCSSQNATLDYEATAFSNGQDVTSTVGSINWVSTTTTVATANTTATGLHANQARITAKNPGLTQLFASTAGATSTAVDFTTCLVKSITLSFTGDPDPTNTSATLVKGAAKGVTATVLDTADITLTTPPLTWITTNPAAATVSTTGSISAVNPGGAGITAACIPTTCNIGLAVPPIYAAQNISVTVSGAVNPTTLYVTSSACRNVDGCTTAIVPITIKTNVVATPVALPHTPDSFILNQAGTKGYLGNHLGHNFGLMIFDPAGNGRITSNLAATGTVLAVSPNGNKVITSDATTEPNQLFVFDSASSRAEQLVIEGAFAAKFSPDNSKAYILAKTTAPPSNTLYVYSPTAALKTIPLSAPVTDLAFHPNGAFVYLAGGAPGKLDVFDICNDTLADTPATGGASDTFLSILPDGKRALVLDSPGIDLFDVTPGGSGCPLTVTNSFKSTANFGQGDFTATQFLVAADASRAYVLTSNLANVLEYDASGGATSSVALTNSASPVRGVLTTDSTQLYLSGDDFAVHRIDTGLHADAQAIPLTTTDSSNKTTNLVCGGTLTDSLGNPIICNADLMAIKQ